MIARLIFRSLYWLTAMLAVWVLVFAVLVLGGLVPVASESARPGRPLLQRRPRRPPKPPL